MKILQSLAEMIEVLESIDDGLQALIALANGEQVEQAEIQESMDILLESGDVLTDLNKTIAQYNQAQSTVTCPGCGANHEAGLHTCSACFKLAQAGNPVGILSLHIHVF